MVRILHLIVVLAAFSLGAVSAQQPSTPRKPVPPRSPTYPTPAPANPPSPAPTAPQTPQRGVLGPAPNITGNTATLDTTKYTIGRRVFAAGARSATWHMHTAGQLVFAEAGSGRLQIQGQPIKELAVGESAFIPGGSYHWHGAAPNADFTMVYVTMGQSKTSQGEPVTDDVYMGRSEK